MLSNLKISESIVETVVLLHEDSKNSRSQAEAGNADDESNIVIVEATSELQTEDYKMEEGGDKQMVKESNSTTAIFGLTIPPSLTDYHCHFSWAAKSKKPFTEEEAKPMVRGISKVDKDSMPKELTLKHNGMHMHCIGNRATNAFCNIALNKPEDGKLRIEQTREIIKKCVEKQYFSEEYVQGFEYVLRGLEMFILCQQIERDGCEEDKEKLEEMIQNSVAFESLSVKGQVGVHCLKLGFVRYRRLKDLESVQLFRELIRQDGDYFLWYYDLYTLLRVRRRDSRFPGEHVGPDEEEKALIIKAAELAPDNPTVIIGLCRCLLQIYSATNMFESEPWDNPIEMGTFGTFTTGRQIVEFTRQMSLKPKEDLEDSRWLNLNLAEFFGAILPYHLRDNGLAKECLQKALDVRPNSSKSNHRMAAFYLTAEKNPEEAMKYYKIAVANCPTNFPALCDMIQTMMGNIQEFDGELNSLFQENLENPKWGDDKQGNLYFLFGMFMFIKKDAHSTVDNWIKSYSKNPQSIRLLKNVPYSYNRYRWKRRDISIQDIHSFLKAASADISRTQEEIAVIKKILEAVDVIVMDDICRSRERFIDRGAQRGSRSGADHCVNRESGSNVGNSYRREDNKVSDWRCGRGGNTMDMSRGRGSNDFRTQNRFPDSEFLGRGDQNMNIANHGRSIGANQGQNDSDVQDWRSQCGSPGSSDTFRSNDNRGGHGRGGNGTECRQQ